MAKRHASLVPLSHDHHHGLALALRLRQGDNALLNDGWTHDRQEQATRVMEFYRTGLQPHFAAEEEVVFPMMQEHVAGARSMLATLIDQHRQMERAIGRIGGAGPDALSDELVALGRLLEVHIRMEERELFPLFESALPGALAEEAGRKVAAVLGRYDTENSHSQGHPAP